jgi:hypothetical protein
LRNVQRTNIRASGAEALTYAAVVDVIQINTTMIIMKNITMKMVNVTMKMLTTALALTSTTLSKAFLRALHFVMGQTKGSCKIFIRWKSISDEKIGANQIPDRINNL